LSVIEEWDFVLSACSFTLEPFVWKIVVMEKNFAARQWPFHLLRRIAFYRISPRAFSGHARNKMLIQRVYIRLPIRKLRRQWDHCCPWFICMWFSMAFFSPSQPVTVRLWRGSQRRCAFSRRCSLHLEIETRHFSPEIFNIIVMIFVHDLIFTPFVRKQDLFENLHKYHGRFAIGGSTGKYGDFSSWSLLF